MYKFKKLIILDDRDGDKQKTMKKIILSMLLIMLYTSVNAQTVLFEKPLVDYYKPYMTIYTDSAFKNKKSVYTYFLTFRLLAWQNRGWKAEKHSMFFQNVDTVYVKADQFVFTPEYRKVSEKYNPYFKGNLAAYHSRLSVYYGQKMADSIFNGVPVIGMTEHQFYLCMGKANETNITHVTNSTSKQLIFKTGDAFKYYYFTDGKLTAIQN